MRGYNEYIGARYVPVFDGDWDNTKEYEPLVIVSYQGNSYTSKTFVPKNTDINNTTYWALTGNYNAQVEAYRQEVARLSDDVYIVELKSDNWVTPEEFGAVGDGQNDDTQAIQNAINSGKNVLLLAKTYKVTSSLACPGRIHIKGIDGQRSIINSTAVGFTLVFSYNSDISWHEPAIVLDSFKLISDHDGIKFDNITQGVIQNCSIRVPSTSDYKAIFLDNESHYCRIINNFVFGGIGISNSENNTSNGLTIEDNYLSYGNCSIRLYGFHHKLQGNHSEGGNVLSYDILCDNSYIDVVTERNVRSDYWVNISGNSNDISLWVGMDGVRLADSVVNLSGQCNNIKFMRCSGVIELFTITSNNSKYNVISIYDNIYTQYNVNKFIQANMLSSDNKFIFNDSSILINDVDALNDLITDDSAEHTYNTSTHRMEVPNGGQLKVDLTAIPNYVEGSYLYVIYNYRGESAPTHGYAYMHRTGDSVNEYALWNNTIASFTRDDKTLYIRLPGDNAFFIEKFLVACTPNN